MKKFGPGEHGGVMVAIVAEKVAQADADHDGKSHSVYVSYSEKNAWGQYRMTAYVVPSDEPGEMANSKCYALWKRLEPRKQAVS